MTAEDAGLIGRVVSKLRLPPTYAERGVQGSILIAAAGSYGAGAQQSDGLTQPTGFDPEAARLFEAIVESAYLVANADGDFDKTERSTFEHVVLTACEGKVGERQISALLEDLREQLSEDGLDKRVEMVARSISKPEHAREILRVAALLAHISGGVSSIERTTLERLAGELKLEVGAIDQALAEATQALSE
jgi:tellurite resistance protein